MKKLILICALILSSCGYSFQGGGSVLPPDVRRIQIPLAQNNSTEPGLDQVLTEAIVDRFERFGVITVVEEREEADAVLFTRILELRQDTATSTSNTDVALQQQSTMLVSGELRRVTGPVLWKTARLTATSSFGSTGDVVVTSSAGFAGGSLGAGDLAQLNAREVARSQEGEVLDVLAEDIARKIYDAAVAPEF